MVGAKLILVIQIPNEILFFYDFISMFVIDDELAVGKMQLAVRQK
jgi:hypothetical protein